MTQTSQQGFSKALELLLRTLDCHPINVEQIKNLLPIVLQQGESLQARLLLTGSPRAKSLLPLLPPPNFWAECWPNSAHTQTETLPDFTGKPYFSVITPSYNQKIFIQDTVRSVLGQDFASYEHIIMDGGSTDGTSEYIRQYPHITYISEPDRGQTHALNKALALAQGEIIAWINSDDFYMPATFQCVHDYFTNHPEESIVTGDCLWGWEKSGRLRYVPGEERDFESLIRQWNSHVPGPQPSIFFRRSVLEKSGYPDESLHYAMDYDLWLRMAHKGFVRRYLNIPVAFYRFHGLSKSGDQQDWTTFYDEWYQCFTKFRPYSKILPAETLLTVAYPLRAAADSRERASLCAAVHLCTAWKLRDLEVLLVTDHPHVSPCTVAPNQTSPELTKLLPGLTAHSLPIRIAPVNTLNTDAFVCTAVKASHSFALAMPPLSPSIPYEQWFVNPLGMLLDTPAMPQAPLSLRIGRLPAHPFLAPAGPVGCLAMHRRTALAQLLSGEDAQP
ncbi:MAG: glycosyltransferase family 2 protein [Desulfovibrionaceae bacterium]